MRETVLEQQPEEQDSVSVGSPTQAAAEGALLQLRNLNLLQLDEDGSHSDHSPHSAQAPETAINKFIKKLSNKFQKILSSKKSEDSYIPVDFAI